MDLASNVDLEAWQRQVLAELKGKPLSSLERRLASGLALRPLYTAADRPAERAAPAPAGGRPAICPRHDDPRLGELNAAIQADLAGGAGGIWLQLDRCARLGLDPAENPEDVGVDGAPIYDLAGLEAALAGVDLAGATLRLDAGANASAAMLVDALRQGRGIGSVSLCLDPLGALARDGALPRPLGALWRSIRLLYGLFPVDTVLGISTAPYHEAGADEATELACGLAAAVAALRGLEAEGLDPAAAAAQLEFSLPLGRDILLNLLKIRALRALWAHVLAGCGAQGAPPARIHAHSAAQSLARVDAHTNLLRVTCQVYSALLGGVEGVTPAAFDEPLGQPGALGRRLARNVPLLLLEEAGLGDVADPTAGSYAIEALTAELAGLAWARFQELERRGGLLAALQDGSLRAELSAAWKARIEAVDRREEPLVGVNVYPDLGEAPGARFAGLSLAQQVVIAGETLEPSATRIVGEIPQRMRLLPEGGEGLGEPPTIEPLPQRRLAARFEALRARVERHVAAGKPRPTVYLATLGPPAEWSARASFAADLLQAGGIAVATDPGAGDDPPDAAAAALEARFAASKADLACLCASDKRYATHLAALAARLPAPLLLAGAPDEARKAAGIARFLYRGGDARALLAALLDDCQVTP